MDFNMHRVRNNNERSSFKNKYCFNKQWLQTKLNKQTLIQDCLYARASAPLRDYYGLTINEKEVILNVWNITHGPHVFPRRLRCPLQELEHDKSLTVAISNFFGKHVLQYSLSVAKKDPKLQSLPSKIFLYILRYLATKDILSLGQSSKIFFELCNGQPSWKMIFSRRKDSKMETPKRNVVAEQQRRLRDVQSPRCDNKQKKKVAFCTVEESGNSFAKIGEDIYTDMRKKFEEQFRSAEESLGLNVEVDGSDLGAFEVAETRKIKPIKKDNLNLTCNTECDKNYYKVPQTSKTEFNRKLSECASNNPQLNCLRFEDEVVSEKKGLWKGLKSSVVKSEKRKVVLNNVKVDNSSQQRMTKNNQLNEVKRGESGFKLINNIKPKGILKKSNVNI
ncbi:PREDICTED: uncharacterized protein LOC108565030 [Nicrophorus vespilloides]|uniref:Uncharacterized protein LOC108565030 n=1 Tax=Nicrophorus vespilloides TaxID=110193 RepID=A0ABM1MYW7_NICVS|nr:PREDICTED: uncharacterized protein LOC108565030 [Nicrophorus vespilloides]